jgi:hypothetical protein
LELILFRKSLILLIIFILCISFLISPQTGFTINKYKNVQDSYMNDGYILFAPERSKRTFLLDYDKEINYTWDSDYTPGFSTYLLDNGHLIHTSYLGLHPIFFAGGMAGGFQEIGFNGEVLWDFQYKDNTHLSHHDVEPLPNGNILVIAWEYKSSSEIIQAGRNPINIPFGGLWPDHIIEVKKNGVTSGEIVWEWYAWDHLIQDYDPTKDNYGVVEDHPELIDINFDMSGGSPDWLHSNSIDYNEEFDQIIISVRNFNEFWVIDHSTTTEEAAGHTGGNNGKGGDLLYRWGNPLAYRMGTEDDQELFGQHDANWIKPGSPGEGNILVFNNGIDRPGVDYSSVDEIIPPVDEDGNYHLEPGCAYEPDKPIWSFITENPEDFYSASRSGAQRLTDGNTLICDAEKGYFFEVTPSGNIVWEYINPYPDHSNNTVFKIFEYGSDYSGIEILLQPPEIPSIPSGPTEGLVGVEYEYLSFTSDPNENQIFYKFDWDNGNYSEWIGPFESGEDCVFKNVWKNNGTFMVKVKAKDNHNYESEWSNPLNVIIGNVPPELPIISGPQSARIGLEYDYSFELIDLNDDNVKYIINWGDGNQNESDYYPSGTKITLSHSWTEETDYTIKAKLIDIYGLESDWATLDVSIPRTRAYYNFNWLSYLEQLPFIQQILNLMG